MLNDLIGSLLLLTYESTFLENIFIHYNDSMAEEVKLILTDQNFEMDLVPEHNFIQGIQDDSLILF